MEEQKYYTPALDDLRIGFNYEIQDKIVTDVWRPNTINTWHGYYAALSEIGNNRVRVPYLTAEQIEAEGWTKCESLSGVVRYKKPFYSLSHSASTNNINVTQYAEEDGEAFDLFSGKCRCINDLKLICKLLGIQPLTPNNSEQ